MMTRFPQTLVNVQVNDKHAVDGNAAVPAAVAAAEAALGDSGRVLLRPSRHRAGGPRHGGGRRAPKRPSATPWPLPTW